MQERRTIADYLDTFVRLGDNPAYVQRQGLRRVCQTYRQVAELAFRFARELEGRAIGKGDRVLLWGPNLAEWTSVFLGCALRGVIVVPMDDVASPDFSQRVVRQVGASLVVTSAAHFQDINAAPHLVLESLGQALDHHSPAPCKGVTIGPQDILQIIFTSGATAEPKGVVISHANVLANIAPLEGEIQRYLKYERLVHPLRFLQLLPLSHVFGQFLGIFVPPLIGGTVVFQDTLKPADIISAVRREKVSVLVSVPRVLQSLKENVERECEASAGPAKARRTFAAAEGKHFLRRWWMFRKVHRRFGWKFWAFISGGAALDPATEEFWGRLGFAVVQGYGLTETTSLISVNHPFKLSKGSIGKALPGREVKLAEDGEVMVRGSGVASGYWDAQGLKAVAGEGGWYRTGDVGELDAAGNLYFKGRKKDVIVTSAGMKVYPEDLESALCGQPEVKDCVVVAMPVNGNAEACAIMVLRRPSDDASVIIDRANQSLAEFQRIRRWFVWPEEDFPRTSTQKPRRGEIVRAVQQSWSGARGHGESILADLVGRITKGKAIDFTSSSDLESDLGLGSLDRVELISAIEERYQVDLAGATYATVNTVGDLQRLLQGEKRERAVYHYPHWVQRWPVTWIRLLAHYLLVRPAVYLLGYPRVVGRENLKGVNGPVLMICNHIDDVDVGFVQTALPLRLRHKLATAAGGEALEALRTPPAHRGAIGRLYDRMRWALGVSLLNLFPLPRAAGFRESFAYAGASIDRGYSVLIFPEGHHTIDGKLRPFKSGVGLLAKGLQVPVVPMRIDGLYEVKAAGKRFAWPGQIQVKIGVAESFAQDADATWIAETLQKKVEQL